MKNIRIKRHLTMKRICEKGFCDSDFIKQIEFDCKHCLVYKIASHKNGQGLTKKGCNEYQARKIAKDYILKYNKGRDAIEGN